MNSNDTNRVQLVSADPSALGLFGLAMVTLVASSQKLGLTSGYSFVIPWAIFLGAFAQLFACIQDAKRNNTFGTTAFGAYALFWFSVAFSWMIKMGVLGEALSSKVDEDQLALAFFGYFIFTLFMTVGAAKTNKVLFTIFILIDFLFLGLCYSIWGYYHQAGTLLAGLSELAISILSFYGAVAAIINLQYGKILLPVGKPLGATKE